jgi:hypothetical protein
LHSAAAAAAASGLVARPDFLATHALRDPPNETGDALRRPLLSVTRLRRRLAKN